MVDGSARSESTFGKLRPADSDVTCTIESSGSSSAEIPVYATSTKSLAEIPSNVFKRFHRRSATQLMILSLAYLCGLGIWNALNGLGGLGTGDENLAHYANTVGYFIGIPAGAIAGGIINIMGLKQSVFVGAVGQAGAIFFYYIYYYRRWVPLYAVLIYGCFQGFTVSLFMSSICSGVIHYAIDSERSHFIAISSAVLNIGGVIGSAIGFSMNMNNTSEEGSKGLNKTSYEAMVITASLGIVFSAMLCHPEQVIRKDGTRAHIPILKIKSEIKSLGRGLIDVDLWLMAPLFMCAFWHEVVLFNFFNTSLFNVRSRAINGGCYFLSRIVASFVIRYACDAFEDLRMRIYSAVGTIAAFLVLGFTMSVVVFSGGLGLLDSSTTDVTERRAAIVLVAFIAYGALETMCSSLSLWLIGVLPFGDANAANRYIGWYRMFGSVGGLVSWVLDLKSVVPHIVQWVINIVLWVVALVLILFLSHKVLKRAESKVEVDREEEFTALTTSAEGSNDNA